MANYSHLFPGIYFGSDNISHNLKGLDVRYRPFGKGCDFEVSEISLGTVSLGMPYGIPAHGNLGMPDYQQAVDLLRYAAQCGITLYDTAPAYGNSEKILGEALGSDDQCRFATKITMPCDENGNSYTTRQLTERITASIHSSLRNLRRDTIDILQVHNLNMELIARDDLIEMLCQIRQQGKFRCLGATVYTVEEALAVVHDERFHIIQVAYNLLDRSMGKWVLPEAHRRGMGVMIRSIYLKGVLTQKATALSDAMQTLRSQATTLAATLTGGWSALPEAALRFCLSNPNFTSALIGPCRKSELTVALRAYEKGALRHEEHELIDGALSGIDAMWLDPRNWPLLA